MLLTGGQSSRMGDDKATLLVRLERDRDESLAARTGRILRDATDPVVEVGPGRSGLPAVVEENPGSGPLAGLACGALALRQMGWDGPIVVLATDLPRLTGRLVAWLADHPDPRSVVPVAGGRPQSLCARYAASDVDIAIELAASGRRSMRTLLGSVDALLITPADWLKVAGDPLALQDVDTPEDLRRIGLGLTS